jgi:hypothetical protein
MKGLFEPHGITFDSKETVLNLNGCSIEAYPSNHIDAFRSLTNPKFTSIRIHLLEWIMTVICYKG